MLNKEMVDLIAEIKQIHGHRGNVEDVEMVMRVGKHAAGRLLDGRTWDQFPEVTQ